MKIKYLLKDEFSEKDFEATADIIVKEFGVAQDPMQVQRDDVPYDVFMKSNCEEECIIKDGEKVIGSTYLFLTSKKLGKEFMDSKITERELLQESRRLKKYDSIYFCSAIIIPEYRRKGLIFEAGKKSIESLIQKLDKKPKIFAWIFSEEGKNLLEKLSNYLEMDCFMKED